MTQADEARDTSGFATPQSELAARALSHVLGLFHWQLRDDTPLADIGADSVAIIVFADVAEAFAAQAKLTGFAVDNERLRRAATVGDLAQALSWDRQ